MIAAKNETGSRAYATAPVAADWLGLAAAPTFAAMAIVVGMRGEGAEIMCSTAHGASPLGGMVPMYVLMSAFHSAPWLKLISCRGTTVAGHSDNAAWTSHWARKSSPD